MRSAVVVLLLGVGVAAGGCGGGRQVRLSVTPARSPEDRPPAIRVSGLRAHERVSLTVQSRDVRGVLFRSRAAYATDAHGDLDVPAAPPVGSSDPTGWGGGLLASMRATTGSPLSLYFWPNGSRTFRLTLGANGTTLATSTFQRVWSDVHFATRRLTMAANGIEGAFFSPVGVRDRPAVVVFGGSEGGESPFLAGRLAAHGIPTLSIAYFHAPGLPDRLVDIPLEYFRRAVLWLKRQPQADPRRISLVTASYGSEAALLVGAHYPGLVAAIVAAVPSSVVTCGIEGAHRDIPGQRYCSLGPAWTLGGKPVPYTRLWNEPLAWDDPKAIIPVERIRARVLLACGGVDDTWSSCPYADAIVARRRAHGESTTLFRYPKAGHAVGAVGFVDEPGSMATDLSTPWDEVGREDLWPKVLAFLRAP